MKTKKIVSLLMALAMTASLAVPAFASSSSSSSTASEPEYNVTDPSKLSTGITTKVTGLTSVGDVKVFVPTTGAVVLNPYKLSLKYDAATSSAVVDTTDGSTDQVISPIQYIVNGGTSDLIVYANATGISAGNLKFAAAALETDDVTNSVYMTLEAKAYADDSNDTPIAQGSGDKSIVISTRGTTTPVAVINADGGTSSYLGFNLAGTAVEAPKTNWTDRDKASVNIIFTFVPGSTLPATP